MKVVQTFFKAITITSTTLLLGLAGCAFDEPIDYTTDGTVNAPVDPTKADDDSSSGVGSSVSRDGEIAKRLATGRAHACAVLGDKSVECWGSDDYGQSNVPVGLPAVTSISASYNHTCAILEDQNAQCWGSDDYGQSNVPDGLNKVIDIATGNSHTCVLEVGGAINCWGKINRTNHGSYSYIYDINDENFSNIQALKITSGANHFCAITENNVAECWGSNIYGQTNVPSDLNDVVEINAGFNHTCAVSRDKSVSCWGDNNYNHRQSSVPVNLGPSVGIASGYWHSCALLEVGSLECWGHSDVITPPMGIAPVSQISSGGGHFTCALSQSGQVSCWGNNNTGALDVPENLSNGGSPNSGATGTVEWTQQLGTTASDSGKYITTDESNNIIVLGNTTGHLNGDTNRGNNDFFVAKYSAEGEQLWTSLFGGTANDIGTILEVAPSGSMYVGGRTNGSLPNSSNVGNPDVFLVKFNAAGEKEWHHQIGSYAWDYAHGIAIDSNENVYLSGSTGSHYGDALGSFAGVSHLGRNDTFIIKYDSEGNRIWTKLIGTGNSERSYSDMAIDAQDNLYISGVNDGNLGGQTGSSGTDVFVMKLDSDGNEIWTKLIYSHSNRTVVSDFQNGNDSPYTNLVLGSSGKIYLIAHTTTNFDNNLNMGGRDLGLAILDNNGNTQCSTIFGTSEDNNGSVIAVDNSNNFYIGYNSSVSIDNTSNLGGSDGFILKYDDNCNHVNTEVYGSDQDDTISSIAFDSSDNLIITGRTLGTLNGDSNLGSSDVFIKKVIK